MASGSGRGGSLSGAWLRISIFLFGIVILLLGIMTIMEAFTGRLGFWANTSSDSATFNATYGGIGGALSMFGALMAFCIAGGFVMELVQRVQPARLRAVNPEPEHQAGVVPAQVADMNLDDEPQVQGDDNAHLNAQMHQAAIEEAAAGLIQHEQAPLAPNVPAQPVDPPLDGEDDELANLPRAGL